MSPRHSEHSRIGQTSSWDPRAEHKVRKPRLRLPEPSLVEWAELLKARAVYVIYKCSHTTTGTYTHIHTLRSTHTQMHTHGYMHKHIFVNNK